MRPRKILLLAAMLGGLFGFAARTEAFETKASEALLIDADSGAVLFSKDADRPFAPAALAKLMTMEVVFEALKDGEARLEDAYPVSENAWRTGGAPSGGSTMFAVLKSKIPLGDLIQGVIVQSANDGAIVIAEGFSGSEDKFAERMNERARAIGLAASAFRNASGLPAEGQMVTARDLVTLAGHIQKTYPDFYKIYAQPEFTWNKIRQRNRNPLLAMDIGADGMGTGYTHESGYAIVASAGRGGRRVIAAMSGMTSERERAEEARKLLDWGLDGFRRTDLFAAGDIVGEAKLFGGEKPSIAVMAEHKVTALVPSDNHGQLTARIVYDGPVAAPVEQGEPIGRLEIWAGGTLSRQVPLVAAESVALGGLHRRALDAATELVTGWMR